tara:strand:+ start:4894 stop:9420 length:4527 start_codon:yes stop_codon:yes gene_type:complete
MCGGSTNQTTQQVTIPPNVLARYDAVNAKASKAAETPFQEYGGRFVAPTTAQQQRGFAGTDTYANYAQPAYQEGMGLTRQAQGQGQSYINGSTGQLMQAQDQAQPYIYGSTSQLLQAQDQSQPYINQANQGIDTGLGQGQGLAMQAAGKYQKAYTGAQPYQQAATNLAMRGTQSVDPTGLGAGQIQQYMDPYLSTVVGNTAQLLNQQNQQGQAGQLGNAIRSGAFGGDRSGIAAANLAQQQGLAAGSTLGGLLSQGYGQALSTAQQQQGVNLGAAQANRAAVQQGAGQMLGIGQQGYAQAMGVGQAQQGLGQQQFAQNLGAAQQRAALGQQQYSMGANTAQQLAALGQQQYGMGANTAQQLAALGQQQYTMGANTANQIASLGAGAQTAGLQGAQAQLAAGQIQQQTDQAEDTALYNQFLQKQSYPFQVAQFEANIAEGTGGLSGSTTTTRQPGGFFSDRRLKENVKEIGKTFDGQPIYSYRYKEGDSRTQIGLMAQDVEKKHPEAVGVAGGYRTVNYEKATEEAADRGHFYSGGVAGTSEGGHVGFEHMGEGYANGGTPILPGLTGTDMQSLLQSQAQMYAPFGQGGLYGGQAGGLPGGGSSYVPQANLPVTNLATAGDLPSRPTGLDQAKQWADLAEGATSTYEKGSGIYDKYKADKVKAADAAAAPTAHPSPPPKPVEDFKPPEDAVKFDKDMNDIASNWKGSAQGGFIDHYASGGVAGHYAAGGDPSAGGMPYSVQADGGLNIPTTTPHPELKTPGAPGQQESGLSKVGKVADIAKTAVTLATMAGMARGGVAGHYAVGGRPDDGSMPYSEQVSGLNIPNETPEIKTLDAPGSASEPETGLSKAAKVAKIAATAAKIATMVGMASGGTAGNRHGYAVGGVDGDQYRKPLGSVDEDEYDKPFWLRTPQVKWGQPQPKTTYADKPPAPAPTTRPDPYMFDPNDPAQAAQAKEGRRSWAATRPAVEPRPPVANTPSRSAGVAPPNSVIAPTAPVRVVPAPPEVPAPTAGVAPPSPSVAPTAPVGVVTAPPEVGGLAPPPKPPSALDRLRAGVAPEARAVKGVGNIIGGLGKTYLDKIKSGDSAAIASLLAGIGAMGTAPTRSFGAALSAGVGTGAQAYMSAKEAQADINETKARTVTALGVGPGGGRFESIPYPIPGKPVNAVWRDNFNGGELITNQEMLRRRDEALRKLDLGSDVIPGMGSVPVPAIGQPTVPAPNAPAPMGGPVNLKFGSDKPPTAAEIENNYGLTSVYRAAGMTGYADSPEGQDAQSRVMSGLRARVAKDKADFDSNATNFAPIYSAATENLKLAAEAAARSQTNTLSGLGADLIGKFLSIPGVRDLVPEQFRQFKADYDIQKKTAIIDGLRQVSLNGLGGAPAAALQAAALAVADTTLDPEAKRKIIAENLAKLERENQKNQSYFNSRDSIADVRKWENDWYQQNPLSNQIAEAKEKLPPFAGAPSAPPKDRNKPTYRSYTPGMKPEPNEIVVVPGGRTARWDKETQTFIPVS